MIHILGAGSMGCLWAAQLSYSNTVSFVSSREKHCSNKQSSPNTKHFSLLKPYKESTSQHNIPIINVDEISEPIETLLVCTKSHDALKALTNLESKLSEKTTIILFQNGLGSQFEIIEAFPDNAIFAAVSTEGVNRLSEKEVIHAGLGSTQLGALTHSSPAKQESTYQKLTSSGLSIKNQNDIWQALWTKLIINCAINPFTALINCPNGEIKQHPLFQENWPSLKGELANLMLIATYPLDKQKLEQIIFEVIENTQTNISSMLQDVRNHKNTEIDHINGFAYRYLKKHQCKHAINKKLWESVNALGN